MMVWSSARSRRSARRQAPARSATARSSSWPSSRRSASGRESPASRRCDRAHPSTNKQSEGNTMKLKLNPLLAGVGAAGMLLLPALVLAADEKPKLDTGDTAWMLTSTALVLMMTIPGLALFYGGMVRKKNVLATVMQSFAVTCLISILWLIVGYSLAFMPGSTIIGGLGRIFLRGLTLHRAQELSQTLPL